MTRHSPFWQRRATKKPMATKKTERTSLVNNKVQQESEIGMDIKSDE
jgi:hypothetical protein